METVLELKEYNQEEPTDQNPDPDKYTDRKFPLFYTEESLNQYLETHKVYGKVFEYDREEYETFHNADENDFTVEVPEPISEWVVD